MTFPKLALPAMLSLMMLGACSTTAPTPVQHSADSPIKAVPCTELPIIHYHIPSTAPAITLWLKPGYTDPTNALDTPETVMQVRKNNAARNAVCGP